MSYATISAFGNPEDKSKSPKDDSIYLQSLEEKKKALSENKYVLSYAYTTWCVPCKRLGPEYSKLTNNYNRPTYCMLVKENAEEELTAGISAVPTFIYYKNGKEFERYTGTDLDLVESKLQEMMDRK